jgi:hypothetical protein
MYAALSRSACALPLNLICGFETTSIRLKEFRRVSWKMN